MPEKPTYQIISYATLQGGNSKNQQGLPVVLLCCNIPNGVTDFRECSKIVIRLYLFMNE
jgi:hypothetical protein